MPIFGTALAFLLLSEAPSLVQIVGAALVLSGIALVERRSSIKNPFATH
jgi:drug/metabolite transporter (DMT)-like permease